MREIKFRAWMPYNEDPNDMRMEYYPQLFAEDGNGIFNINSVFAHPIDYFADNGTYPEAVIKFMQYTGLRDKNGREIYEGDVVRWGDMVGFGHEKPVRVAVVRFDPDICFDSNVGIFDYGNFAYKETDKYLTVIGNIFENPELLEVAKHDED